MRRFTPGMVALAIALLGVPAASAHDNDQVVADCVLSDELPLEASGDSNGTLAGYAVTPEAGGGSFSCRLVVNGVDVAASTPTRGERVFVSAGSVAWSAHADDDIQVCAHVDWDDGHPPYRACDRYVTNQIPPQEVVDLVNAIVSPFDDFFLPCLLFSSLTPGVPGVLDVTSEGDVFVAGEWLWDCPPYGV